MKIIRIKKDKQTHLIKVDDEDYGWLRNFHWIWRNGYACTRQFGAYIGMHRLIMGVGRGDNVIIDHIDGSHINNQKYNLRKADRCQNQQNRKTNRKNTLPKGIRKLGSGKYNVRIQAYNTRKVVGTFDTLEEAVSERNRVARQLHKDFYNPSYILNK